MRAIILQPAGTARRMFAAGLVLGMALGALAMAAALLEPEPEDEPAARPTQLEQRA